jgi:hypothetical protein
MFRIGMVLVSSAVASNQDDPCKILGGAGLAETDEKAYLYNFHFLCRSGGAAPH